MAELLSSQEIEKGLETLPGWKKDGDEIVLELERKDFMAVVELINKIADSAEKANHHPNLNLHDYNKLMVTLFTHSKGGITQNDLDLAKEINTLI